MSFCPLCGRGGGNGGDPCARCERAEMEAEREAERTPFLPEDTTGGGVGVDMTLQVVLPSKCGCEKPEEQMNLSPPMSDASPLSPGGFSPAGCGGGLISKRLGETVAP